MVKNFPDLKSKETPENFLIRFVRSKLLWTLFIMFFTTSVLLWINNDVLTDKISHIQKDRDAMLLDYVNLAKYRARIDSLIDKKVVEYSKLEDRFTRLSDSVLIMNDSIGKLNDSIRKFKTPNK